MASKFTTSSILFSRRWVNPPAENVEYHDEAVEWKSILVLTGPNQYREIWFDEKVQGDFSPSFLSQVGDKMLLGLIDECYRCGCLEQYWLFDKDGPTHIELEPIWRAAIALVPKGHYLSCTYNYRDTLTYFSRGAIEFGLDKQPPEGGPAEHVPGIIKVSFNWDRGQVVITGTEYDPTAE